MRTFNLHIGTFNLEPKTGWYIADGSTVADALEDAFNHYPHLRETFQNLIGSEVVR